MNATSPNNHPTTVNPAGAAPTHDAQPACARLEAFCDPKAKEVFQSVVYQPQIWVSDRYDVEEIHSEAREVFQQLLRRAATKPAPTSGKLLLLHGEAGSGKTHLMRAFRTATHEHCVGYFGYLQMTTVASNYAQYMLSNLVESLQKPYFPPTQETTGLTRLSTGLFDRIHGLSMEDRERFREGEVELHDRVRDYAAMAVAQPDFVECDEDLIRAMLYLQRNEAPIRGRVSKWLLCEQLSDYDRESIGGLVPRTREEHPLQMIAQLGELMHAVHEAPMVICIDQLENVFNQNMAPDRFRQIVDAVVALADVVPTSIVVIACLEDYYKENRQHLAGSKLDRLEKDPDPIRLRTPRTLDEIEALVARRLQALYEDAGLANDLEPSPYPFRREHLAPMANIHSSRRVLDFCRDHQHKCILAGRWVEPAVEVSAPSPGTSVTPPVGDAIPPQHDFELEPLWNDFRTSFKQPVPEEDSGRARLLAWAIDHCAPELPAECRFDPRADLRFIEVQPHDSSGPGSPFTVAICEKAPQGGGLGRQVTEAELHAGTKPLVLVRSTAFPRNPNAAVSKHIGRVIAAGGRRVVVEDSDWRAMLAFREFADKHRAGPADAHHTDPANGHYSDRAFLTWQKSSQPLSRLASLRAILAIDQLPPPGQPANRSATPPPQPGPRPKPVPPDKPAQPKPPPPPSPADASPLLMGQRRGLDPSPVNIAPREFKHHMAFLGGTGTGKTTAALSLIEQLLLRGVPAILLDRKGDLARYADPDAWYTPPGDDPDHAARLQELQRSIDVVLYTPGSDEGRPLAIPIVPDGLGELTTSDREQVAAFAAAALGGMMLLNPRRGTDQILQVILAKAIEVQVSRPGRPVTLDVLYEMVQQQDEALLSLVGGYEPRHYKRLAENLLTLKLQHSRLLGSSADGLDIESLLGRAAPAPGKTRLTIINTQSLGGPAEVEFWVTQFFLALDRWRAKSPSDDLQAVVLIDEADQYLPAIRQPSTKAPLESLLRRSRSAGLGLMLSTQSPGDFDYKCKENIRAWLVGRVREQTAVNKLKPMFSEARGVDVAAKLPAQATGEFYLLREKDVIPLLARPSLIKTLQLPEQRIVQLAGSH